MYKLTNNPDVIVRLSDDLSIPRGHRWWDDYEDWCKIPGNTLEPEFTITELKAIRIAKLEFDARQAVKAKCEEEEYQASPEKVACDKAVAKVDAEGKMPLWNNLQSIWKKITT